MREFAAMRNLDVLYARLGVDTLLADLARVATAKGEAIRVSSTDTMPLTRRAKDLRAVGSLISLAGLLTLVALG